MTNAIRTGNPVYPLATSFFRGPAAEVQSLIATWIGDDGKSWGGVWSGYFLAPQTLDEDVGGLLFLAIAALGIGLAFRWRGAPLRIAALTALAMWALFLPLTAAMRLLLPAVVATLVVAGAALEQATRARTAITVLTILFALRGELIVAAHNARFMNPLPAAVGIETEKDYLARNFPPAALYARLNERLPPEARFLAVNEVRLFRFPRPVTAGRVFDPPLLARYIEGAQTAEEILQRLRRDRITHLLLASKPVERGPVPKLPPPRRVALHRTAPPKSRDRPRRNDPRARTACVKSRETNPRRAHGTRWPVTSPVRKALTRHQIEASTRLTASSPRRRRVRESRARSEAHLRSASSLGRCGLPAVRPGLVGGPTRRR